QAVVHRPRRGAVLEGAWATSAPAGPNPRAGPLGHALPRRGGPPVGRGGRLRPGRLVRPHARRRGRPRDGLLHRRPGRSVLVGQGWGVGRRGRGTVRGGGVAEATLRPG